MALSLAAQGSRRSGLRALALGLLCALLAPGLVRAAGAPKPIADAVEAAFRPLLKQYDAPGIAVAVTVNGRPYVFNYGVASRETGQPVTEDTLFEIGSVSKTFTATLAAYAMGRGAISLDDHPSRHMPQLRGSALDKATLLDLGAYAAGGLPLQFPDEVQTQDQMLAYFQQWKPTAAPGTVRRYSNPSIGLLGYIAALSMHRDFADLMETAIFPGLGLRHTHIRVPPAAMASYAWGYNRANAPVRVNPGVLDAEAYGVKSTAADMIRFVQANIRPGGLAAPIARAVEATHVGYFKAGPMVQGLGWEQHPFPVPLQQLVEVNSGAVANEATPVSRLTPPRKPSGAVLFNKTGSTGGFGSYVAFVPEKRIGIVMLANRNIPIPARVTAAHAVLEALAAYGR